MIKKFIGIVFLGLLLSCSEFSEKKKIEKCADPKAIKEGAVVGVQNGKNIILFQQDFEKDPDPLGLFEKEDLIKLSKMDLKDKISEGSGRYEKIWDSCEREFSQTPVKFKEKYLN